ncbi:MAG: hypothetical protein AAF585_29255, partial [Verrucomicrobiota bacterium]
MNQVIQFYLRRWWWVFAGATLFDSLAMLPVWIKPEVKVGPIALLMTGVFILSMEVKLGRGRTLLALPLTASDVGRSWRFVAFLFPLILTVVAVGISSVIALGAIGAEGVPLAGIALIVLRTALLLGALFFAIKGVEGSAVAHSVEARVRSFTRVLVWIGVILACIFLPQFMPNDVAEIGVLYWLIGVVLLVLTILGWKRAETLAIPLGQTFRDLAPKKRGTTIDEAKRLIQRKPIGAAMLLSGPLLRVVLIGATIMIFNSFIFAFMLGAMDNKMDANSIRGQIQGITPILTGICTIGLTLQIRVFKIAPVSRLTLGLWMTAGPLLATAILMFFGALIYLLIAKEWLPFDSLMRMIGVSLTLLLLTPTILKFRFRPLSLAITIVLFAGAGGGAQALPIWIALPIGLSAFCFAFWANLQLL